MKSRATSRTRTLGWVLVAAAGLLVTVVIVFVGLARRKAVNWLAGVPRHLGANIQQETNGFTYDQSLKGRKIFTVHAAKEMQHRDGRIALHDVGIVLYGPTGRAADRIHGQDFEFDPKAQRMTAQGDVYIDLVPPEKGAGLAKGLTGGLVGEDESRLVHVKTVGLTFSQADGAATTEGAVEFRSRGYSGSAVGASYDAHAGIVELKAAVRMSGLRDDRPVVLTASSARMERASNLIDLRQARYVAAGDGGSESIAANHAVVHTLPDGTPQRVDADGQVTLENDRQGTLIADRLQMDLGDKGQAHTAHLAGNLRYVDEDKGQTRQGRAEEARLQFDNAGRPSHASIKGGGEGVSFTEKGPLNGRTLHAATVELALAGGGKLPTVIEGAEAFGPDGAELRMTSETGAGAKRVLEETVVRADRLTGHFARGGRATELAGLDGMGHSTVLRTLSSGAGPVGTDASHGDVLHVDFKPGVRGRDELTRAEQRGSVTTEHTATAKTKAGRAEVEHARADSVVFEAAPNLVHLAGSVALQDDRSLLLADRVDIDRGSGDATAVGSVRVAYQAGAGGPSGSLPQGSSLPAVSASPAPASSSEPIHVLAARAQMHKATGVAEFTGEGNGRARMWQGGSQVEAPTIELDQQRKRLRAHGDGRSELPLVRAVLAGPARTGDKRPQAPLHVTSRELTYVDTARNILFGGPVTVEDRDGVLRAREATVWLSPASAAASGAGPAAGMMGSRVERMTATGAVEIDQPGRRATGEKLLYTAADGTFLLTGTVAAPPRVVDQQQGSTTGAAIRFKTGDDSVEILGGVPGSQDAKTAGRVRSETRMK